MSQVSLRELVQKYSRGEIGKEEYRKTRTELIKNVLDREATLRVNTYPPLVRPADESTLDITERSQKKEASKTSGSAAAPPSEIKKPPARFPAPLYIAGALILVVIVLAVIVMILPGQKPQKVTVEPVASAPPAKPAPETSITAPAQKLIGDFLQQNTWDTDSLDEFLNAWHTLSDADRQSIKGSMSLNRLTNAIYTRLQEERAIVALDKSAAETRADFSREESLVFFARQLGIKDDRIKVQTPALAPEEEQGEAAMGEKTATATEPEPLETSVAEADAAADQPVASAVDVDITPAEETPAVATSPNVSEPEPTTTTVEKAVPPATTKPATAQTTTQVQQTAPPAVTEATTTETAPPTQPATVTTAPEAVTTTTPVKKSGNCNTSLLHSRRPYCRDIIGGIGNGPTMVIIPPGKFMMGGDRSDEQPRHNVVINHPFAMSVHEITYGEYQLFCKDTNKKCPAQPWAGNDYPVVNVSWQDAVDYTAWLSEKTGQHYRLPSESEWEYAARGGTQTIYPFGDTIDISYAVFSERKTLSSPLPKTDRTINRNKFRLYHIVGNVREWVADTWSGNYKGAPADGSARTDGDKTMRIARGGSYQDNAEALRSAARQELPADTTDNYTGFRVIQDL